MKYPDMDKYIKTFRFEKISEVDAHLMQYENKTEDERPAITIKTDEDGCYIITEYHEDMKLFANFVAEIFQ